MIKCSNNKHQFLFLVILIALILLTNNAIKAEYTKVDNNKSLIVFHDGLFDNGLPYNTFIDDGK
jgi:hypothetical protein